MMRIVEGLPEGVFGIEAGGDVSEADIDEMEAMIDCEVRHFPAGEREDAMRWLLETVDDGEF